MPEAPLPRVTLAGGSFADIYLDDPDLAGISRRSALPRPLHDSPRRPGPCRPISNLDLSHGWTRLAPVRLVWDHPCQCLPLVAIALIADRDCRLPLQDLPESCPSIAALVSISPSDPLAEASTGSSPLDRARGWIARIRSMACRPGSHRTCFMASHYTDPSPLSPRSPLPGRSLITLVIQLPGLQSPNLLDRSVLLAFDGKNIVIIRISPEPLEPSCLHPLEPCRLPLLHAPHNELPRPARTGYASPACPICSRFQPDPPCPAWSGVPRPPSHFTSRDGERAIQIAAPRNWKFGDKPRGHQPLFPAFGTKKIPHPRKERASINCIQRW